MARASNAAPVPVDGQSPSVRQASIDLMVARRDGWSYTECMKPIKVIKTGSLAKPVKAGVKIAPPKKLAKAPRKAVPKRPRVVSATLSGGYRVLGTPIKPKHTTREKIAEAVASLK